MKQLRYSAEVRALNNMTGILFVYRTSPVFYLGHFISALKYVVWIQWDPELNFADSSISFEEQVFKIYALTEEELQFFKIFSSREG